MSKWETALQHPQNSHFHCQHQRTHQPYQEVSLCTNKSSRWWSRECIHYSPSRIKEEMCHEIQSVCHSFFLSQDSLQTPTAQSQDLSTGLPNKVCQRWRPSPPCSKTMRRSRIQSSTEKATHKPQTSHVIRQCDVVIGYFISEENFHCEEKRVFQSKSMLKINLPMRKHISLES